MMQYGMSHDAIEQSKKLQYISELYIEMATVAFKNHRHPNNEQLSNELDKLEQVMKKLLGNDLTSDLVDIKDGFEYLSKKIKK